MYRHLSVDVGEDSEIETWTVERSLQQFFQPEKRDLKCERCDAGQTATQTLEIISCPKALILHFKRFIVTQEEQHARKSTVETSYDKDQPVIPPRMEMVLRKNEVNMFQCAFLYIVSLFHTSQILNCPSV
jgi:ubiquitin C-terminal hydrolase